MIVELTYEIYPVDSAELDWEFKVLLYVPGNGTYTFNSLKEIANVVSHFSAQEATYYAKDLIMRLRDGRESFAYFFPRFADFYQGVKLEVI